jgi:stage II sporulation protein GA (sporulation sigma-E factor processing peptidase)
VKVYFDLIWLFNFALDFLLIWSTASLLRIRLKKGRTALAAALGACYAVFIFFPSLSILYTHIVKFMFALGMIAIAFGYRDLLSYVRSLATFYLVSFIVGGGIFAIHYYYLSSSEIVSGIVVTRTGGSGVQILGSVVIIGFGLMLWFSRKTFASVEKRQHSGGLTAKLHIEVLGNHIHCQGLVDTGNQLSDPITRIPVMILETSQISHCLPKHLLDMIQSPKMDEFYSGISAWDDEIEWQQRLRLVPYRGVNKGMQFMVAFKPDKVVIEQDKNTWELTRVLIGLDGGTLSKDGDYQAIIHPSLMLQQTS